MRFSTCYCLLAQLCCFVSCGLEVTQEEDMLRPRKKRHARPHELDSDDEEGNGDCDTHKGEDKEMESDKVEPVVPVAEDVPILVNTA